jgi:Uma2 family endonuclease
MERITDISQLDLTKKYTYADYLNWWFDDRVELIKGFILKMTAPSVNHQSISGNLHRIISNFLWKKPCKVFYAPFDVRLVRTLKNEHSITVVQPDISVVCDPEILDAKGCNGPPDWIIEILSLSNSKHDIVTKFKLYEEAGVKEYWIVYPYEGVLDVYHLEGETYQLFKKYAGDDLVEVKTLPGLVIDLKDVFEEV